MKARVAVAAVLIGLFFGSTAAYAEGYIGVGVSNNSYDYSDLSSSTGNKLYGGYYSQNGLLFEIAHIDLGDTVADFTSIGFQSSGFAAYVGYRGGAGTGFEGFGKVGLYSFDSDLLVSGSTVTTESGSGLAWSLGISYAFNKNFAVRGELEQFVGVKDFASDKSISGGSVSLEARF